MGQGFMQIHEHGAECGLSDDKGAAALASVKKLQRREPSPLPPCRRKPLIAVGCEARIRPALCRSHNASPARLPVMLMKILTCSHLGRSRPTSRVACVTGRRVRGVKRGCGWAAGAGRLPPLRRRPPRRRGCDDLSGLSPTHLKRAQEADLLSCCSCWDETKLIGQACGMPAR